nr:reverse transcriptase domain-containing protein [Tanacetum cinerariifolium]
MTAHHNDWDTSVQRSESSSSSTSSSDPKIVALKAEMAEINKNLMKVLQINQQVKAVAHSCETCGGPHSYNDCLATIGQTQNVYAAGAYNQGGNSYQPQGNRNLLSYHSENYLGPSGFNQNQNQSNPNQNYQNRNQGNSHGNPPRNNQRRNQFFQGASHGQNPPSAYQAPAYQAPVYQAPNMFGQFMKMNTASSSGSGTLLSNTITNSKEDLKGITTRSGIAYKGPTIPTTSSPPKVVKHETEPVVDPVVEPVEAPVSAPKPNLKPSIPYPSRIHDQKLFDKTNDQKEKFFQIFHDFNFNISFADALILMPKRSFLKTRRALIDVYEGELTLRVGNKDDMSVNRIDVIDVACEEYSQEILGFSVSGNPTPSTKPIIFTSSPTLTSFEDSDFLLEETDAFLATEDEPISPEINDSYYD